MLRLSFLLICILCVCACVRQEPQPLPSLSSADAPPLPPHCDKIPSNSLLVTVAECTTGGSQSSASAPLWRYHQTLIPREQGATLHLDTRPTIRGGEQELIKGSGINLNISLRISTNNPSAYILTGTLDRDEVSFSGFNDGHGNIAMIPRENRSSIDLHAVYVPGEWSWLGGVLPAATIEQKAMVPTTTDSRSLSLFVRIDCGHSTVDASRSLPSP